MNFWRLKFRSQFWFLQKKLLKQTYSKSHDALLKWFTLKTVKKFCAIIWASWGLLLRWSKPLSDVFWVCFKKWARNRLRISVLVKTFSPRPILIRKCHSLIPFLKRLIPDNPVLIPFWSLNWVWTEHDLHKRRHITLKRIKVWKWRMNFGK